VSENRESISDQELDELLTQARWPQASSESSQRLRESWSELAARRTLRPSIWWSVGAVAAVLIIAIGAVWMVLDPFEKTQSVANSTPLPHPNSPTRERGVPSELSMRVIGREPNLVELAYMQKFEKKRATTTTTKPANQASPSTLVITIAPPPEPKPTMTASERVAKLLDRPSSSAMQKYLAMVMDPQTKRDALSALDQLKHPPTDQLIAVLSSPRVDLREAAALALGRIDGPVTTRKLIQLIEADRSRREAFLALASSRGPEAQAFVRRAAFTEQLASYAQSALAQNLTEIR